MRAIQSALAAVLLISPALLAQHTTAAPTVHVSAPSPSISHTPAPVVHIASPAPAAHAPSPSPSTHTTTTPSPASTATAKPIVTQSDKAKSNLAKPEAKPHSGGLLTWLRGKGHDPKDKPDLSHKVLCGNKPCHRNGAGNQQSNLSHHVCLTGCAICPAGQLGTVGKCVSAPATHPQIAQACPAGQTTSGGTCTPIVQCPPGQTRNGATCKADCSSASAGSANLILELRSARQQRDEACRQDPMGLPCQQAQGHYSIAESEYRNFLAGVPAECRGTLSDPSSL